ncbi:hypothetical protein SPWS13_1978 [Shewanella putrefaciens]|nr:hypothetical protein SPWS13_1978 [Shewanella putrefaciens]
MTNETLNGQKVLKFCIYYLVNHNKPKAALDNYFSQKYVN